MKVHHSSNHCCIFFFFFLASEWGVNQARDTYASYIGHYPMLAYFAVAENESIARVKYNIAEVQMLH